MTSATPSVKMHRLLPTLVIIRNQRDLQLRDAARLRRGGALPRVARPSFEERRVNGPERNASSLWDQLQISKVLATYCRAIDRCDKELLKSVYWPDAREQHGIFNGNAWDFAEFIVPMLSGMKSTTHQISNTLIDLRGNHAAVETYVCAYHSVPDGAGKYNDLIVGGRYLDRMERRQDEWRIAQRTFVMDWNQNQLSTAQWEGGLSSQLNVRGAHDRSDPSYPFFAEK